MTDPYRIYLAGSKNTWRKGFSYQRAFDSVVLIDPFEHSRQGAPYQFVNDDLAFIEGADLVFAVIDYEKHAGTVAEIAYAHALGKPIVMTWALEGRVNMFTLSMCSFVFFGDDVRPAMRIVEERYLP